MAYLCLFLITPNLGSAMKPLRNNSLKELTKKKKKKKSDKVPSALLHFIDILIKTVVYFRDLCT